MLTPGARITGRITAADTGKGVAGVSVGAESRPQTSAGGSSAARSDADGRYSFRVAPGRQHVYLATRELGDYNLPDKHAIDADLQEGETLALDFVLPPVAAEDFVSGRVVDARGEGLAGAEVYVCTPREWMFVRPHKADAQGFFRVHVPEVREWQGRAKPPSPLAVRLFARTGAGLVTARGVDARGGARDLVLTLVEGALAQVSGQVNDAEGRPLGNVPVRAYVSLGDLPGCNRVVRTDTRGGFTFDGLWPGLEFSFTTEAKGYTREGGQSVTLQPAERKSLPAWTLAPANLSVAGTVVDAAGHPAPGATIYAQAERVGHVTATSDAAGAFWLGGLVEGWLTLDVNSRQPTATSVRVKAGDQTARVELPPPRTGNPDEDDPPEHFERLLGKPAPALQAAEWLNVPAVSEEQRRGKVVLVDFWALTCGPCLRALPEEQKFWEAQRANGLLFVGLHNSGPAQEVREFLAKQGLQIGFPLAMDGKGGATATAYGVVALPTYAVIDREGVLRHLGHAWEPARQKAVELLGERP